MKWKKYTITTHIDAVDILSYELDSRGIEGIEIEDHLGLSDEDKEKMFVDIPPEPVEKDDIAKVSFYLEVSDDGDTPAGTSSQIVDTDGVSDISALSAVTHMDSSGNLCKNSKILRLRPTSFKQLLYTRQTLSNISPASNTTLVKVSHS